jgi:hypothetical protein
MKSVFNLIALVGFVLHPMQVLLAVLWVLAGTTAVFALGWILWYIYTDPSIARS